MKMLAGGRSVSRPLCYVFNGIQLFVLGAGPHYKQAASVANRLATSFSLWIHVADINH